MAHNLFAMKLINGNYIKDSVSERSGEHEWLLTRPPRYWMVMLPISRIFWRILVRLHGSIMHGVPVVFIFFDLSDYRYGIPFDYSSQETFAKTRMLGTYLGMAECR